MNWTVLVVTVVVAVITGTALFTLLRAWHLAEREAAQWTERRIEQMRKGR